MLQKGSLRGWPYLSVKNSQKKNLKNILSLSNVMLQMYIQKGSLK